MKGTFFQKPLEFSLDIKGESWRQGDLVEGSLLIKNHAGEDIDLSDLGCHLIYAAFSKIKVKAVKEFIVLDESLFPKNLFLNKNTEQELPFHFQLLENCPITDKTGSLYISCGDKEKETSMGQLQLQIDPDNVISNFIEVFKNYFYFKIKTIKNKKECIEIKLVPPSTKEYSGVQQFNLSIRMNKENLEIKYMFKVKKINFVDGVMGTKDEKQEFQQTLSSGDYLIYGDAINLEGLSKSVGEILDQVKIKPIL